MFNLSALSTTGYKTALKSEMCTIIVVSPLISVMRNDVEQLKQLGFSAAAIGIGEEFKEDEKRERENVRSFSVVQRAGFQNLGERS